MHVATFMAALFFCVASISAYPLVEARGDKSLVDVSDLDACAAILVRVHAICTGYGDLLTV